MIPIPVERAKSIAEAFGYSQVVIIARAVGSGGGEHVTTYGKDAENCSVAARIGFFLKHKVMGWPSGLACTGCSQQVQEDWTYCPYCGAQDRTKGANFVSAHPPAAS